MTQLAILRACGARRRRVWCELLKEGPSWVCGRPCRYPPRGGSGSCVATDHRNDDRALVEDHHSQFHAGTTPGPCRWRRRGFRDGGSRGRVPRAARRRCPSWRRSAVAASSGAPDRPRISRVASCCASPRARRVMVVQRRRRLGLRGERLLGGCCSGPDLASGDPRRARPASRPSSGLRRAFLAARFFATARRSALTVATLGIGFGTVPGSRPSPGASSIPSSGQSGVLRGDLAVSSTYIGAGFVEAPMQEDIVRRISGRPGVAAAMDIDHRLALSWRACCAECVRLLLLRRTRLRPLVTRGGRCVGRARPGGKGWRGHRLGESRPSPRRAGR